MQAPYGAALVAGGCIGCGARGETRNIVLVQNVRMCGHSR
jgi:hypothetical protein